LFSFQFIVYGGFWIAISLLFVALFVGSNFCRGEDIESYKRRVREEGILLSRIGNSNRQNLPKGTMTDEGRRDVPVGATEPQ